MDNEEMLRRRPYDPFDVSAKVRQHRMGLLDKWGQVNLDALTVFSRVYAGLFYDDLIDSFGSISTANDISAALIEKGADKDARRAMLAISLEYDSMHRSMPEPVWWIVGSNALLSPFISTFLKRLKELIRESEVA